MSFSAEEITNLQQLLLHKDTDNVRLGLGLAEQTAAQLPDGILVALNMLHVLSPIASMREEAGRLLALQEAQKFKSKSLVINDLDKDLKIFEIAQRAPHLGYKRAYARFVKRRDLYEPLFLMYTHWQRFYRELLKLFYIRGDVRLVISYCDALLRVIPSDFVVNNYRFQSVNYLLEQGQGQEELPNQERWLRHWQSLYPNTSCMIYTMLGQLFGNFYADKARGAEYYRLALAEHNKSQWDNYAATASNNLACILVDTGGDLREALALAQQANQLDGQNGAYRETLGYLQWKVEGDWEAAEANFLLSLELEPQNLAAASDLVELYVEREQGKRALRYVNLILSKEPEAKYLPYTRRALAAYVGVAAPMLAEQIVDYLGRHRHF